MGMGWIFLTALCDVWELLEAARKQVQQQADDIKALKEQQAVLREALQGAMGSQDLAEV